MNFTELGEGIANGELSPVELLQEHLEKINRDPERDKIFTLVTEELALEQAKLSLKRAASDKRLSPLDGIPIVWKDNFDIKGYPTSAGVKMLAEKNATADADAIRLAESAGLVCLGKTNMTELAFSGLGINPSYGTPENSFSQGEKRVPGGSSSGSAIAVAKGLAPAGIGTDTGGSVRIPSAWNSLYGFKTTNGLLSTRGIVPLSQTLDSIGFLTRSVGDAALLYSIFAKTGSVDLQNTNIKGKRLLVPENYVWENIDAEVEKAVKNGIEKIANAGAEVVYGRLEMLDELIEVQNRLGHIINYEANRNWRELLDAHPDAVMQGVRDRFDIGRDIDKEKIGKVYKEVARLQGDYIKRMEEFDGALMPTTPNTPPQIKALLDDADYYAAENMKALQNTKPANFLGACSATIPCGVTSSGLPVGLMLYGVPYSDAELLKLSAGIESVLS
jgi:aspartyl-tRNA(Asn)/glutamyl-tRNA(Gln) amidotransferase subunit A